jgi:type I restriction enzyme S subunit
MSELSTPASWAEVTVGEILDVQYGKALATKVRQAGDVGVWTSGGETGSHNASLAEGPALVIGRKGAAGRVHLVDGPFWATDTAYYALVPEGYSPAFLYWCLTASRLDRLDQSTALPSLSRDHLRAVKIAVPPLHEQRAIVAAIENAFARIDAIGVELDSVAALTANFRRSSERDAFATASGTTITLGELCAQQGGAIQTGPFGSQLHAHD